MDTLIVIEILAALFNFIFLILLVQENIRCWSFGIVASLLSVHLFIENQFYSEAILYSFYALAGIYGWLIWSGYFAFKKELKIQKWKIKSQTIALIIGVLGTLSLGYFFDNNSDAKKPYFDAFSTSFSFVATYMEAHKVLSAWIYWVGLNVFSVWLYQSRNLNIYASLMVIYAIASVWGYLQWKKKYEGDLKEKSIN